MAETCRDDPELLNWLGWVAVRKPDGKPEAYRLALRQAETACRLDPQNGAYRTTLGITQYRLGRYADARTTLTQAEEHPAALAVRAMACFQLGEKDEAKALLDRLRETLARPEWAKQAEAQALAREAALLIR